MPRSKEAKTFLSKDGTERLYRLMDIQAYGLDIPEIFTRCFKCHKPAVWVLTCYADGWRLGKKLANHPSTQEFIEQMREWAGSNIELPVCDLHKNYGEIIQ